MSEIKIFIENINKEVLIKLDKNKTFLEVLLENDICIQHNCEGNGVCGKCHVIFDEKTYKNFKISEEEEDVLFGLIECTKTSRLACKIRMNKSLDGAKIKILNLK